MENLSGLSVLVIGGLGRIGNQIIEALRFDGCRVSALDIKEKILANDTLGTGYFFENNNIFEFSDGRIQPSAKVFDVVIICTRVRTSNPGSLGSHESISGESIENLISGFQGTITGPLEVMHALIGNTNFQKDLTVIWLYSTNSMTVSHQDLAYHVTNGAVPQLCRFLALSLRDSGVRIYPVEIGVISLAPIVNRMSPEELKYPPIAFLDLHQILKFLCVFSSFAISGSPITLAGGRNFMDSTAAYEKYFGDLGVRPLIPRNDNSKSKTIE
jgi:hypothetical protein